MALADDINALPTTVGDGNTGHLNNHQVIHAALKDHEQRLTSGTAYVDGRVPPSLALRLDTTVGTRIMAGTHMIHGDTGWRDVTSLYTGSSPLSMGAGGKFLIRRVNSEISFKIMGPFSITAATGNIMQLLTGWQAHGTTISPLASGMNILRSQYWIALQDATVGYSLPADWSIEARWMAAPQSWPTSLPGTPA